MPRKAKQPTPPKRQRAPRPGKRAQQLNEKYQIALAADQARRFLAHLEAHQTGRLHPDSVADLVDQARKMNAGFGNELHLRAQNDRVEMLTRAKKTRVATLSNRRVHDDGAAERG